MVSCENKIFRLSPNQLRALYVLSSTKKGIISSTYTGSKIGKIGKSLGGLFSSLSRQIICGEHLIIPWGKSENGRGLRWKLNTKLISLERLHDITKKILSYDKTN